MLQRPSYRRQWERKRAWYASHGILPYTDGGRSNGVVTTQDGDDGSISSADIETVVDKLFG